MLSDLQEAMRKSIEELKESTKQSLEQMSVQVEKKREVSLSTSTSDERTGQVTK